MKKKQILSVILISGIVLFSCQKNDTPTDPLKTFSGAIDSIITFSGNVGFDSGFNTTATMFNPVKFEYDKENRVSRMIHNWFGYSYNNYLFSYSGSNKLPYAYVDSMPEQNIYGVFEPGIGQKIAHKLYYDNQSRVILDSVTRSNLINAPSYEKKYYIERKYSGNTMAENSSQNINPYTYDSTYLDNLQQEIGRSKSGQVISNVLSYYDEDNPLYKLNIKEAIFRFLPFWTYTDDVDFDFFSSKKLVNEIIAKDISGYIVKLTKVKIYYNKDAQGRIFEIVIVRTNYSNNYATPTKKTFGNLKIYYHQ